MLYRLNTLNMQLNMLLSFFYSCTMLFFFTLSNLNKNKGLDKDCC